MTGILKAFLRFRQSSSGISSRYNETVISMIFESVNSTVNRSGGYPLSIEAICPLVEKYLKSENIAVMKKDLTNIITEILNFLIDDGRIDTYDEFMDEIDSELKKTIWPFISWLNDSSILDRLIEEIFNLLDNSDEYTSEGFAEKLSEMDDFKCLSFNELLEISDNAILKLEELYFLVD